MQAQPAPAPPARPQATVKPKSVSEILAPPRGQSNTALWLQVGGIFLGFHFFLWVIYAVISQKWLDKDSVNKGLNLPQKAKRAQRWALLFLLIQVFLMAILAMILAGEHPQLKQVMGHAPGLEQSFNNWIAVIGGSGWLGLFAATLLALLLIPRVFHDLFGAKRHS